MESVLFSQLTERRARNRVRDSFPVDIVSGRHTFFGKTIDFNDRGLSLVSTEELPTNPILHLMLHPIPPTTYPSIPVNARIVWTNLLSKEVLLYGLRIVRIDGEGLSTLKKKITQKEKLVVASYLPETVVKNEDIIKAGLETTPVAIRRSLGAVERRSAGPNETAADMMVKVANQILDKAGVSAIDIDRIICVSNPGDSVEPDTSVAVQTKIGAKCPAFGISMSCTGWIAAFDIALRYLATGEKRILLLAASLMGSRPYFHNLMHRAIFGDGAGGLLLEPHHRLNILSIAEIVDGTYYSKIFLPHPWSLKPPEIPDEYKGSFYMSPDQETFFSAMDHYLPNFSSRLLKEARVSLDDIDLFLLHYPSKPLFEHSLKLLNVSRTKVLANYERLGNVVAAEIPILLSEAVESERAKPGDLLFMLTYGAGFTMGGMIMRLS